MYFLNMTSSSFGLSKSEPILSNKHDVKVYQSVYSSCCPNKLPSSYDNSNFICTVEILILGHISLQVMGWNISIDFLSCCHGKAVVKAFLDETELSM